MTESTQKIWAQNNLFCLSIAAIDLQFFAVPTYL